ncbi:MAG: DUF4440 domain-containing protein [Tenuifilaceae bacterium]
MKKTLALLVGSILLFGCGQKKVDTQKTCDEIMQADRDFSQYSIEHGKNAAFLKFAAEDVTFLSPNSYPLVGIKLLEERQAQRPDTTYTLRWEPVYASAAESGELGYTYGTWELVINNTNPEQVSRGTYVTIWKRNEIGEWKYVFDTGQEGLGEEK